MTGIDVRIGENDCCKVFRELNRNFSCFMYCWNCIFFLVLWLEIDFLNRNVDEFIFDKFIWNF